MTDFLSKDDFKRMCLRYIDDDLNESELANFNEHLEQSSKYRKLLLEVSRDEVSFYTTYSSSDATRLKRSWWMSRYNLIAAAALFLISIVGLLWIILGGPGALSFSIESSNSIAKGSMLEGELNPNQIYELNEGEATLLFSDGTKVDLKAPVKWECVVQSNLTKFYIHEGELYSKVEKQIEDRPFVFQSEHMKNIIVGTQIIMKVKSNYSEVEVVEGIVRSESAGSTGISERILQGQRLVIDKLGEWSKMVYTAQHKSADGFEDRPLRDYVFKVASDHQDLQIDVLEGEQKELIDIQVKNGLQTQGEEKCFAYIKPDRLPRDLQGFRMWVKGTGSGLPYLISVHNEELRLTKEVIDDDESWKVLELDWDDFDESFPKNQSSKFSSEDLTFLSFSFSQTQKLSVKYIEFLK